MASAAQHVKVSAWHETGSFDAEAALRACKLPMLWIDALPAITEKAKLVALAPQLETAQTACSGHFHQLFVPEQVNAMIERFAAKRL